MPSARRNLNESWAFLKAEGYDVEFSTDGKPVIPDHMPNYDDEVLAGLSFFRTWLRDSELNDLTLPRVYMGRTKIERVNFRNSFLGESRLNWNDFIECDFTDADLTNADAAASIFIRCNFSNCILNGAELRADFQDCTFKNAQMNGAKFSKFQKIEFTWFRRVAKLLDRTSQPVLSPEQIAQIDWSSPYEEPPGG